MFFSLFVDVTSRYIVASRGRGWKNRMTTQNRQKSNAKILKKEEDFCENKMSCLLVWALLQNLTKLS